MINTVNTAKNRELKFKIAHHYSVCGLRVLSIVKYPVYAIDTLITRDPKLFVKHKDRTCSDSSRPSGSSQHR